MLFDRVGVEEKLLIREFESQRVKLQLIDVRKSIFRLNDPQAWQKFDVILDRSVSFSKSLATLQILQSWDVATVNSADVASICGDKLRTSLALQRYGIPTPAVAMAYSRESALEAIEAIGYPVVLKPVIGSWGRLLSRINDRDAAETVLEHKSTLGHYNHHIFYIQEYIEKSDNCDVRSFSVDGETICAISRSSPHWITNTARGGRSANFKITSVVDELTHRAAAAVGGGLLAVDLFQDRKGRWLVNELNHSMEFRNSIEPTGVAIPRKMVHYVLEIGRGRRAAGSPATAAATG